MKTIGNIKRNYELGSRQNDRAKYYQKIYDRINEFHEKYMELVGIAKKYGLENRLIMPEWYLQGNLHSNEPYHTIWREYTEMLVWILHVMYGQGMIDRILKFKPERRSIMVGKAVTAAINKICKMAEENGGNFRVQDQLKDKYLTLHPASSPHQYSPNYNYNPNSVQGY